jgi:hypothetical protein
MDNPEKLASYGTQDEEKHRETGNIALYIICFPFILQTAFDNVPLIGQYYIIKSIAKHSKNDLAL